MYSGLSDYLRLDSKKRRAIDELIRSIENEVLFESSEFVPELSDSEYYSHEDCNEDACICLEEPEIPKTKYCPKCHRQYPEMENFCSECLIRLKRIDDITKVRDIQSKPSFEVEGFKSYTTFEEIFTPENMEKIQNFKFTHQKYNNIIKNIKIAALSEFDNLVRSNEMVLDYLSILDKVLLFTKSFVEVDYKSYGQELGVFTFNKIDIDDRQVDGLQITTLTHELSHFLIKEILSQIICSILDCNKNSLIDAISTFILTYSPLNRLIDEYSAHTVEGRFTAYGYQDYSSFIQIQESLKGEMPEEEIEIAKSIGNTFSITIKDILESYLDDDLRREIKDQFLNDTRDSPKYEMLAYENCKQLTKKGFMQAIWLILSEGFEVANRHIEKLESYEKAF